MSQYRHLRVDRADAVPLASQLRDQLTWLIVSGEIGEHERLPSVRKLGEQLGISLHTVRAAYRHLEGDGLVSTRQGRGTTVLPRERHRLGRRQPHVRSFTIGVIIPAYVAFYGSLLDGIEAAARDEPSLVFVCNFRDDPQTVRKYVSQLLALGVDGTIVISGPLPTEALGLDSEAGGPIVFADWPTAPEPLVLFDLESAGFQAAEHLAEHDNERIGFITPPTVWSNVAPIYAGYERALKSAELVLDEGLVASIPDFGAESGYEGAARLVNRAQPPSAIFAASDTLAIGAMKAIKERGLRIPDDIALTGIDDIDMAAVVEPPLTTVSLPAYEMGSTAMRMLRRLIAGESLEETRVVLETNLVVRQSCGCGRD